MGRWRTESMFVETNRVEDKFPSLFCLGQGRETEDLPWIKRLYLETMDPTEWKFATEVLGGWQHWKRLSESPFMKAFVKEWREEMEVQVRSLGIKQQIHLAEKGNNNASRWVAEKGWEPKRKAGAPSKEEVTRERKVAAEIKNTVEEDYDRVFGERKH